MTNIVKHSVGRFAPSPTGALHLGSLYAALASYLQARSQQGQWLIRLDDVDTPRNVAGCCSHILQTLENFGLHWDGEVAYQSQTLNHYQQALEQLIEQRQVYPCGCSRKTLRNYYQAHPQQTKIYPRFCRDKTDWNSEDAIRLKVSHQDICFNDELQGQQVFNLATHCGDFIVKRRDNMIAYQLAVVVDDYLQGITEVVRGYDLLESTPRQIHCQRLLNFPQPSYSHVPIITDNHGCKLSKQSFALPVDANNAPQLIFKLLELLQQQPPLDLKEQSLNDILQWAISHWDISTLKNKVQFCQ